MLLMFYSRSGGVGTGRLAGGGAVGPSVAIFFYHYNRMKVR